MMPSKRGKTWRFKNGSIFDLFGVNVSKGTRIRGTPASLVIIDECRDIPHLQSIIESSINPMFITTAGKLVLISTPPDSPLHPFCAKYIADAIYSGTYLHATYRDNPLLRLTDDDLRQMYPRFEDDPVFRREYLADWTVADTSRRIIKSWDPEENDKWFTDYGDKDKKDRDGLKLHMYDAYVGMDPGFSTDALGIVCGYFDWRTGVLVIEAEHSQHNMITADVAQKIREMESALGYTNRQRCIRARRISDVAKRIIADLQMQHGLDFQPVEKHGLTKPAMISLLEDELKNGRIRISPNCPKLRQQIEAGIWDEKGKDYLRTDSMSHLDLLDALKYLAMSCAWHATYKNVERIQEYESRGNTIFAPRTGGRRRTWLDELKKV
jgi:hypothetical protein